jgi:hypothetical protein
MWQIAAYSCADDVFPLVVAELPQPLIKTACFSVRDKNGHALVLCLFRGGAGPASGGELAHAR